MVYFHSRTWPSSPAEASTPGSVGLQRTEFTSPLREATRRSMNAERGPINPRITRVHAQTCVRMLLLPTARMHPTFQASTRRHEWHRRPRRSRNSLDRHTSEPNRLDRRVTLGTEPAASTVSPPVKWRSCRHECDYSRYYGTTIHVCSWEAET